MLRTAKGSAVTSAACRCTLDGLVLRRTAGRDPGDGLNLAGGVLRVQVTNLKKLFCEE